jgi:hypothetical protein
MEPISTELLDTDRSMQPGTLTKLLVPTVAHASVATLNALKQCAAKLPISADKEEAMLLVSHGHLAAHQAQQDLAELASTRPLKVLLPAFNQGVGLGPYLADYLKRRKINSVFIDGTKFVYQNPEQLATVEKELRELVEDRQIFAVIVFSYAE